MKSSAKFGPSLIDFDPERLFEVCKLAGVNVVSTASVFKKQKDIADLPDASSNVRIDEFMFSSKEAINVV